MPRKGENIYKRKDGRWEKTGLCGKVILAVLAAQEEYLDSIWGENMDEMNVLNAPKKVVDGLTEVFEGLAQMFEGVSDQIELLGADAVPEDKHIFPAMDH